MREPNDSWQSGRPYDLFMGRWSKLIAREFLQWLYVPADKRWLDVGCGTGQLSSQILSTEQPERILAVDSSPEFIAFARSTNDDLRLRFEVGLAQSLPTEANYFDAAVSGLSLNFVPDPEQAVAEMKRVTRAGGIVAAYTWDYAGGMQMLRYFWDAAVALDPDAADLDEAVRFPLCREAKMMKLWRSAGLHYVRARAIDVPTHFPTFEDYWQPFLAGTGPAPSYVAGLTSDRRQALKERLRSALPQAAGGQIQLVARAWAVQGYGAG